MTVQVGGTATPEEIAAVVAALVCTADARAGEPHNAYERWRRVRRSLLPESGGDRGGAARDER